MSQQQSFAGQARPNGQTPQIPRAANDVRNRGLTSHNGHHANGSASQPGVGVPVPRVAGAGAAGNMGAANGQGFAGARSPPNAKNTAHVPCKFYKQGACQAGNSCPFLHADNVVPCKYFQKGNCKFGMRCANEHVTPDGRRINKQNHLNMAAQLNLGGRVMPTPMQPQPNSLLSMQHDQFNQPMFSHGHALDQHPQHLMYDIPTIEAHGSSLPEDGIGSPPNDSFMGRSPPTNGLSVLEAPLPASFDSQGISIFARHGPIAASVPARLGGFESSPPPISHFRMTESSQTSALRSLYSSAFGDGANNISLLGMSPSGNDGPPQRMGMRTMHSATYSRPKMLSSSVGNRRYMDMEEDGEDDEFEFTAMFEDAVPSSLNDLLTPQERLRRLSRSAEDESVSNHRAALSGIGTPSGESPKVGSPGALGVSPSRFGPLFQRQQREKSEATLNETVTNAFGHVGSPLRPSHLNAGSSPSLRASSGRPASGDFSISSPPRNASGSLIAQHLQRSRLSGRADSSESSSNISTIHHPGVQRIASGSGVPVPQNRLDRSISTSSSTGIGREKIDEEDGLFAMEGLNLSGDKVKRSSGGSGMWATVAREGAEKAAKAQGPGIIGGKRIVSGNGNAS